MAFVDILFYMFAAFLMVGAVGVIVARNPMYCVLFLIFAFLNMSGLFILLNAEFLALLFLMVYVGAVVVMFLFVLMMVDVDFGVLKEGFTRYMPLAVALGALLMVEFYFAAASGLFDRSMAVATLPYNPAEGALHAMGKVLFTNYAFPFVVSGMILLVAMVGAIVLTHRKREGVKRQDVTQQVLREKEDCVELTNPAIGEGVEID